MRRIAAILAASLVATVLVTSPEAGPRRTPNSSAGSYQPPPIEWSTCDGWLSTYDAQCGFVVVPLDYANPSGPTVRLGLSRVVHTVPDDQYQGIMLTNPGGPGGSGLVYSILGGAIPNGAGKYYDWIGFDPRGVGASVPSLSCDSSYFAAPRPDYLPVHPRPGEGLAGPVEGVRAGLCRGRR